MNALDEEGVDEDEREAALVARVNTGLASRMRWTLWARSAINQDVANLHQQVHAQEQLEDVDDVYSKGNHWASLSSWTRPTSSRMEWTR